MEFVEIKITLERGHVFMREEHVTKILHEHVVNAFRQARESWRRQRDHTTANIEVLIEAHIPLEDEAD